MSTLPHLTDARLELENRVATLTFQRDDAGTVERVRLDQGGQQVVGPRKQS